MDNPELYATSSRLQQQFTSSVLRELWSSLDWDSLGSRLVLSSGAGVVLDVGSGAGDVTARELLPRLPAEVGVVATDVSAAMLVKAMSRYGGPRLAFGQLDIDTHQLEDTVVWRLGPYLKVFSFFCLHWVLDQRNALENIRNLLYPGGETVIILVSHSKLFTMYETLASSCRWADYMQDVEKYVTPYQHSDDPEKDLRMYLQDAGFGVKMCENHVDISYESSEEQRIIDTVTAINPFVDKLPEDLRESFMRDCVEEGYRNGALRAMAGPEGTSYSFRYSALVAHAYNRGRSE